MNWIKYTFQVGLEKVDIITGLLTDIPYLQGIEIEDYALTEEDCQELFVDILPEELRQKQKQDMTPISFYLGEDQADKAEEIKTVLRPFLQSEINFATKLMVEEDWANSWKQYYHSFGVGQNIFIYPIWEKPNPNYPINIGLDPGMAFGSGTHETTDLCLRALEKYMQVGHWLLDIGTGSGILAIAAAKLGAAKVVAVDLDENAIKVARENVEYNQETAKIELKIGNLADGVTGQYNILVANILAEVICLLAKDVKAFLKKDGIFIASGIIADKLESVKTALDQAGLEIIEIAEKGEWRMVAAHV